jgi:hypothetical protein
MANENPSKNFLEEIQSLSDGDKKRVLIIGTIVIMAIVIGVWFTYFNTIITGSASPAVAQVTSTDSGTATTSIAITPTTPAQSQSVASPAAPAGPSLWQRIESGFAWIGNIFKHSSNYAVQPQGN